MILLHSFKFDHIFQARWNGGVGIAGLLLQQHHAGFGLKNCGLGSQFGPRSFGHLVLTFFFTILFFFLVASVVSQSVSQSDSLSLYIYIYICFFIFHLGILSCLAFYAGRRC